MKRYQSFLCNFLVVNLFHYIKEHIDHLMRILRHYLYSIHLFLVLPLYLLFLNLFFAFSVR